MDKAQLMRLKELAHDMFDYLYDKEWEDMIFRGGVSRRQAAYIMAADPKLIVDLIAENERLEKEATWLANKLVAATKMLANATGMETDDLNEDGWRKVAREAVEKNNGSN